MIDANRVPLSSIVSIRMAPTSASTSCRLTSHETPCSSRLPSFSSSACMDCSCAVPSATPRSVAAKLVADRNLSAASFVLRVSDGSVEALPPFGEQGAWFEAFSWSGGEEVQESGGLSGSQQGNETILVADEPGVRKLVCDALTLIGYTVLAAADGYEAMGILEQHSQPVVD